jgi:AraC-like DNA-binding protein
VIYFSTRLFEADQRQDAWGGILAQYCGPFELQARHALDAQMEREMIAGLPCVRIAQNAQYMRRSRKELENTHQDYYYVMLQVGGQSRISQCGTEASMTPGSVVVLDSGRPLSMDYSGKNVHLCFHIPRNLLESTNRPAPRVGQVLTGASALLVGSLMQTAFTNARAFDESQGQALRDSLISLVWSAFTAADLPQNNSGVLDPPAKLRFIHAYIGGNLDAEDLSPLTIARACGLSVRHLHRLFNDSDTSLTRWVRRRRLDRCAADLRNAAMQDESITAIAFRWGFNDTAHFSRSFKAEFGQSARDYRAAALPNARASDEGNQQPDSHRVQKNSRREKSLSGADRS